MNRHRSLLFSYATRLLQTALLVVVLLSCTRNAGVAEFVAYRDAFEASRSASDSLFDLLAIAEREERRLIVSRGPEFSVDDASAFATIGEPPLTTSYRHAFATITQYNLVMVGLASGTSAQQLSGEMAGLASKSVGLATVLVPGLGVNLFPFVPLAQSLGTIALTHRTRALFQQDLAANSTPVIRLMTAMRDGSTVIFAMLANAGQTELGAGAGRRETLRQVVSDWVVLMNRNIEALKLASNASRNGSSGADIATLRSTISDLQNSAEAVREGIALLAIK